MQHVFNYRDFNRDEQLKLAEWLIEIQFCSG